MPDCKACKAKRLPTMMPIATHETSMDRMERVFQKLWTIIILLIVLLVGTNAGWIWYESQFETITQTVEQDAENGTNSFIGGDFNGEAEGDNNHESP